MKKSILLIIPLLLLSCKNDNQLKESSSIDNREIAHVVMLLGQSNAEGCSYNYCLTDSLDDTKTNEYKTGYENVLINYQCDGISNVSNGFTWTKLGQGLTQARFGPELGMAEYISNNYDGKVYIIKNAYGGTSLYKDWASPSITHGDIGFCYESFIALKNESFKILEEMNLKIQVDAICFMQGEEDSVHDDIVNIYGNYLSLFVSDLREELKEYARSEGIGFIDGAIGSVWKNHKIINSLKKAFASTSTLNDFIEDAVNYSYTTEPKDNVDMAHLDSFDMINLGKDFGKILCDKYLGS